MKTGDEDNTPLYYADVNGAIKRHVQRCQRTEPDVLPESFLS